MRTICALWGKRVVRLVLAGLFVYAGFAKLSDPQAFADAVASFQIVPAALIVPVALTVPIFEILTGLLLLVRPTRQLAAVSLFCALAIFTCAVVITFARGLPIDCGCFGGVRSLEGSPWLVLTRNLGLMAGVLVAGRK